MSDNQKTDPMDVEKVLEALNEALALQRRSVMQYTTAAGSMFGLEVQGRLAAARRAAAMRPAGCGGPRSGRDDAVIAAHGSAVDLVCPPSSGFAVTCACTTTRR